MLDKSVNDRYKTAKVLYYSFTHDERLARSSPAIPYDPKRNIPYQPRGNSEDVKKDLGNDREQGIYYQSLVDIMADALIEKSENKPRIMTFHNFYDHYSDKIQRKQFDTLGQLLLNFHPYKTPVLLRIFILQMYIYKAIKVMHLNKERPFYNAIKNVEWTEEELQDLGWEQDKKSSQEHIEAVRNYLEKNWEDLLEYKGK